AMRRSIRTGFAGVILTCMALSLVACSESSPGVEGDRSSDNDGSDQPDSTEGSERPTTFAVIEDGRFTDAAIEAVMTDDEVDPAPMSSLMDEFAALAPDAQVTALADLSTRAELQAATISGLEAVIGGPGPAATAIAGAWTQVAESVDAIDAEPVEF